MTQTILKRVQATLKSVGLINCHIKEEHVQKMRVTSNNWLYTYQINIPLCNFFNDQDQFDRYYVENKFTKAEKLCKQRIDSNIVEVKFIHDYHKEIRSTIEIANGGYAHVNIVYKHKPIERIGVPEQMQLFKVEDYVCK